MFNTMNTKEHYKMYKKGKAWIFAGIVTATLALGTFGGQTAHADTVAGETPAASETTTGDVAAPAKEVTLTPVAPTTPSTTGTTDNSGTKDTTTGTPATDKVTPAKEATNTVTPDSKAAENNQAQEKPASDPKPVTDSQSPAPVTTPKTPTQQPAVKQVTPDEQTTGNGSVVKKVNKLVLPKPKQNVASRSNLLRAELPATPAVTVAQPVAEAEESIDQWMPNKTLQQVVFKTLTAGYDSLNPAVFASGKTWNSVNDITQADMLLLNRLSVQDYVSTYIDGKTSFSLEGLQYATNLTYLDLANDQNKVPHAIRGDITDLTPLKGLVNLQSLQFTANRVSDISPVTGLKNITSITFPDNKVADFSSMNISQYTKGWSIEDQFVDNSLTYVPETGSYIMTSPVKAPQGLTFELTESNAIGIPISSPSYPGGTIRIFWSGATPTLKGDQVIYSDIKDQIMPGQTYNPWSAIYPNLQQEDYTYFLNTVFSYNVGGNDTQTVSLVTPYIKAAVAKDVTVNYVDENGQNLADPTTLTGLIGEGYTAPTKTFAGYELTATPANATGTFSDTVQTVTFVYKEATSSVTVHYQDESGATIKSDTISSGKVGTAYDIAHPDITGYTYKATQGDAQGTYAATPAEVTFVYTKNSTVTPPVVTPAQTITVTVHYQTADGTAVAPDVTVTGKAGDAYTTNPAANVPTGYKLVTTPSNASGTLGDSNFTVTYVYAKTGGDGDKVVVKPTTPTKPTTKPSVKPAKKTPAKKVQKSGQADTVTGVKQTPVATKGGLAATVNLAAKTGEPAVVPEPAASKTTLPQTNEATTSPLWGLAVLGTILGLVGIKFKKQK